MSTAPTNLIFPTEAIQELRAERGAPWMKLVSAVEMSEAGAPERVAFVLMMARINNCVTCNADSFRALQGCSQCTRQSLKRYRGTDEQLALLFEQACREVVQYYQAPSKV